MKLQSLLFVSALLVVLALAAAPGLASGQVAASPAAQAEPGNYCLSCHTAGDDRPANGLAWTGGMERANLSPCPAVRQLREEVYYTERLLLAIDRNRSALPGLVEAGKTDARIAAARQTYSRLLDTPVTSLDAFSSEAAVLRFRLGQSYRQLNGLDNAVKGQIVLVVGVVLTLALLVALGWSWRLTRRFPGRSGGRFRSGFKTAAFLVLVFILFSLPIFRVFSQPVETPSAEAQARQTALDTASRTADAADRAMARVWELARVGAQWSQVQPEAGEQVLATALLAAKEGEMNSAALWGQAQAVQEGTIGAPAAQEKAGLAAERLKASNGRTWALRLMAAEWAEQNPALAAELLDEALRLANRNAGVYRELDVRAIAVTWASLDPDQAIAVANRVYDPGLRAWALWEIAGLTGRRDLYGQAAEAARQVADPVEKSRLLSEIAVRSGEQAKITVAASASLFDEALAALDGTSGPALAYALSDLATATGETKLVDRIDLAYPDARAAALYRLEQYEAAWQAAVAIGDPFDKAHAQAAIAAAWGNADAARQIADPTLRDMALSRIAIARGDEALAGQIESPYYQVQALTGLGQYPAALVAAEGLADPYPLRKLAVAWAQGDPQSALAIVEKLDREVDKAEVLQAVAAATGDQAIFERALGMALAARVRGDALTPVEASLELARQFAGVDQTKAEAAFNQAYEAAQHIATK